MIDTIYVAINYLILNIILFKTNKQINKQTNKKQLNTHQCLLIGCFRLWILSIWKQEGRVQCC